MSMAAEQWQQPSFPIDPRFILPGVSCMYPIRAVLSNLKSSSGARGPNVGRNSLDGRFTRLASALRQLPATAVEAPGPS